jgi:hypothetical protein
MLYPDPRTLQQLIDHHEEPLLAEADVRHLTADQTGLTPPGDSRTPPGGIRHTTLRHALFAVRHPGLQLHHMHL